MPQVFNNSPDETAYFRMILNRENVPNSVVMIQPALISYSFHSAPEPALLDVAAIASDRILLLDSYFTVVIFHGSTVAQWRKAGYQDQPEHKVTLSLFGSVDVISLLCPVSANYNQSNIVTSLSAFDFNIFLISESSPYIRILNLLDDDRFLKGILKLG